MADRFFWSYQAPDLPAPGLYRECVLVGGFDMHVCAGKARPVKVVHGMTSRKEQLGERVGDMKPGCMTLKWGRKERCDWCGSRRRG